METIKDCDLDIYLTGYWKDKQFLSKIVIYTNSDRFVFTGKYTSGEMFNKAMQRLLPAIKKDLIEGGSFHAVYITAKHCEKNNINLNIWYRDITCKEDIEEGYSRIPAIDMFDAIAPLQ